MVAPHRCLKKWNERRFRSQGGRAPKVIGDHHDGIERGGMFAKPREPLSPCLALQRSVVKQVAPIARKQELHRRVAQAAHTVVENQMLTGHVGPALASFWYSSHIQARQRTIMPKARMKKTPAVWRAGRMCAT